MNGEFEIAAGTVSGRDHRQAGKNNHDAYVFSSDASGTVAVVCDGCGSGRHSEVGAKIGARLVAGALRRHLHRLHHRGL